MLIRQTQSNHVSSNIQKRDNLDKLEKKYVPALDNYGQSCFVRSNFLKNEVCL